LSNYRLDFAVFGATVCFGEAMLQRPKFAICLGLVLTTPAAFRPVLRCGFVNCDTPVHVTANADAEALDTLASN